MYINYPVKIHYPGCQCRHYRNIIQDKTYILVSPYKYEDFEKLYFIYDDMNKLKNDIIKFPDNCVCTYNKGKYNGGVIVLSDKIIKDFCDNDSSELKDVKFVKFKDVANCQDNSHLINKFIEFFPSLLNFYTLIGVTKYEDDINHTFPKGKLSFQDKTIEDCCFREFTEETGKKFSIDELNHDIQIKNREMIGLNYIPHRIIINNFLMRIIVV